MEISKGMYIRFNGFISKIGHINTSQKGNTYVQFKQPNGLLAHTRIENIDKASFNIIDLIEVGDYVNGYKIDYTNLKCETPFLRSNQPYRVDNTLYSELIKKGKDYNQPLHFYNDDIKSILTKEQFNSMKYVVERDK